MLSFFFLLTSESNHVQIIKSSWVFEAHQQGLNDIHGQNLLEIHHSSGPEMMPLHCCWQPHVSERLCGLAPFKLVPVICFDHCVAVVRFGALFHPQTLVVFFASTESRSNVTAYSGRTKWMMPRRHWLGRCS